MSSMFRPRARRTAGLGCLLLVAAWPAQPSGEVSLGAPAQVNAAAPPAPAAPQQPAVSTLMARGREHYDHDEYHLAAEAFIEAGRIAAGLGDVEAQAEAERMLGITWIELARYDEASAVLARAFAKFSAAGHRLGVARVLRHQSTLAWLAGDLAVARAKADLALAAFTELDAPEEALRVLLTLANISDDTPASDAYLERGLALAREVGNRKFEAHYLHAQGDHAFNRAEYATAEPLLTAAARYFEETADRRNIARVWTSLGRLYRAHGAADIALDYHQRAATVQEEIGDLQGAIQSLNIGANACYILERTDEAGALYRRALALAAKTGSPRIVNMQRGNLGGHFLRVKAYAEALPLLEESASKEVRPVVVGIRHAQIAEAHVGLHQLDQAVAHATRGIDALRKYGDHERLFSVLFLRAEAYRDLGARDLAIVDARDALAVLERVRANLLPNDYLKRGFHERHRNLAAIAIDLLQSAGREVEALEVSEQARARAFLDLMNAREVAEVRTVTDRRPVAAGQVASAAPLVETPGPVRGALPGTTEAIAARVAEPIDITSPVSVAAAPYDVLQREARRLRTTLISYWVSDEATHIWLATPSGQLVSHTTPVSRTELSRYVRALWAGLDVASLPETSRRSEGDAPAAAPAPVPLSTRRASRDLYRWLIEPIESHLPRENGARLTIVPHGPLNRLSFAALVDGRNRYLVERFTTHYSPSASMLEVTGTMRRPGARGPSTPLLLVANPAGMADAAGRELPDLPGTAAEVQAIVRAVGARQATVLDGASAEEGAVVAALPGKRVLHFATHGVVRDDEPLESFLALAPSGSTAGDEGAASATDADGRLSAFEIYRNRLDADLVVLSACRSGSGEAGGEGIAGLTRAFFYAGAPSVVATLWDVVDGPPARLLPDFYNALKGADKATALRRAQLRLLGDLRARRVKVATPGGPVALPERPVFWASFVLLGEP